MSSAPPPTLTLGELYEKQGLQGRAREIYALLAQGTDAQAAEARRRLQRLQPSARESIELLQSLLGRVRAARKGR